MTQSKTFWKEIKTAPQGQIKFDKNEIDQAQKIIEELDKPNLNISEKESIEAIKGFNLVYDLLYEICKINKEIFAK